MFEALAKLQDAFVAKLAETAGRRTPEQTAAFEKYRKVLALALHPNTPKHEAAAAMRIAAIEAIKLVF